jgi:ABC-type dipeptide/oligopeptide/nickel transport system permease subunit
MKPITWFGTLLALLGILGLAIPAFTISRTKDVVKLGNLRIQSTTQSTHVVPPALCAGVLVLGVILIGAGLYRNR